MASYTATVTSNRPPDEVFTYLADFRSVADWDPSIETATHINADEPIQVGSLFSLEMKALGRQVNLEYTITELEPHSKIVLVGENDSMVSTDTITIAPAGVGGSEVTYAAEVELKGVRKLVDPLVDFGFQRLGDKARDGLAKQLNQG